MVDSFRSAPGRCSLLKELESPCLAVEQCLWPSLIESRATVDQWIEADTKWAEEKSKISKRIAVDPAVVSRILLRS